MRAAEIQQVIISLLNEFDKIDHIQLAPGQLISFWVKEIQGSTALLSYQGKDILARLEAGVTAGERLKCLVEGEKDGQIILRVVSGNREDSAGQTLKSIINNLGLAGDEHNLRLVSEMVKQEMPLIPETTRILSAFSRTFNVPDEDIWIPVFMHNRGIPLTQQMYSAIKELFADMNYLQAEINKLLQAGQNLSAPVRTETESVTLAALINQAVRDLIITGSDGQDAIAKKLAALFQLYGKESPQRTDLLALLEQLTVSLTADRGQESGELAQLVKNIMGKLEFIRTFNSQAEPDHENIMIVYSAVNFPGKEEPLRIIVNYRSESRSKKRDFSSCRVEIKLHTPGLGLVKCMVQVNGINLTVQFITDNEPAGKTINNVQDVLAKRLQELHHHVQMFPCRVHPEKDTGFLPGDKQEVPELFRINLRV